LSYVVLSLKYRPQVFEDVVGQNHVTRTLINAFKKDRVAQGYMFTGPRGVGKTTTARILAKALNCKESPGNPCNKCSNCIEIIDGRNMDVLEIDGASNRGIEEIRNLREQIKYSPMNSPYKIFIIDEVHMLTTPAFNALLRTLEEPPPHGKFILATTDIHKVPSTILSRCQRFDFNRMTIEIIADRIRKIMKVEALNIDDMSVMAISRKADGSMRDALSLLDQVIAYAGDKIEYDDVIQVLGLIPIDLFFDLFSGLKERDPGNVIEFLTRVRESGLPVSEIARGINENIRNMLYAFVPDALNNLELSKDLIEAYSNSIAGWTTKDLVRISKIVSDVEQESKKASQPHVLLEISLMRILEMDSSVDISALINGEVLPQKIKIKTPATKAVKTEIPVKKQVQAEKTADPESKKEEKPEKAEEIVKPEAKAKEIIPEIPEEPEVQKIDTPEKSEKIEEVPVVEPEEKKDSITVEEMAPEPEINTENRNIDKVWLKIYQIILKDRPSIASILEDSNLVENTNNRFTVTLFGQSDFSLHMAEKGKNYIDSLLTRELNATSSVNFILAKQKEIQTEKEPSVDKNNGNNEDTVAKIIELFDGEIVS